MLGADRARAERPCGAPACSAMSQLMKNEADGLEALCGNEKRKTLLADAGHGLTFFMRGL